MRIHLFLVVLVVMQGCASAGLRDEPDRAALQSAMNAAASGDFALAATLADSAAAKCAPGQDGFACLLATRTVLANQFAVLGDASLALTQARSASAAADTDGDAFAQLAVRTILATMAAQAEQVEEAEVALQGAKAALSEATRQTPAAEREGLEAARGMLNGPQARILLLRGEPGLAAQSQAEFIRTMQEFNRAHSNLPVELLNLADMYLAAGDTESALSALTLAASLSAEQGDSDLENEALAAIEALTSPD